ncbi:MAG: pyrroline-5-carboxylate reductase [Alphaproteobacteria bacterium HGW-Alphaproteobacteria-16]|nr:MAG: pyrroline-5-carboxylate reductase [Alphaproteobacteria bacterium HGW-Alphaproteobacteria-16]
MTPIKTLWIVGCGNMAGAMLARWVAAGTLDAPEIFVLNRRDRDLPAGVRQGRVLPDGPLPDAVMLGVKPQQLEDVAEQIAGRLAGVPLLISILAGVEEAALSARFDAQAYLRAMPNMPVAIGKGVVALHTDTTDAAMRERAAALMTPMGLVEWVDAARFDAVTALAGSGPAFLYRFIDALAQAGAALDIPAEQAQRMALAMVEGATLSAATASEPPGALADRVASPGGSTRAGLNVLDDGRALQSLLTDTLAASFRRNRELAAAARE